MLQVHDIRETRVIRRPSRKVGRKRRRSILHWRRGKWPPRRLRMLPGLDVEMVRKTLAETSDGATGQTKRNARGGKQRRQPD